MNRFVVLVDAGYLLTQAVTLVSSKQSKKRGDLRFQDPAGLIAHLVAAARRSLNIPQDRELLRVYWYDGVMTSGLSAEQKAVMHIDDVLFRAGTVNGKGQQKGVDSLIVTDLIELAANHAIADAMLVTGDSDLAVGIDLAQRKGVRIAVLGVHDVSQGVMPNQSFEITSRADRKTSLGLADAQRFFTYQPRAASTAAAAPGAPPVQPATQRGATPHATAAATAPAAAPQPPSGGASPSSAPSSPAPSATTAPKGLGGGVTPPTAVAQTQTATNAPTTAPARTPAAITAAVQAFIAATPLAQQTKVGSGPIPQQLDSLLLHHVYVSLGSIRLTDAERVSARNIFRAELAKRP